jgi:LPS-assembly protein
MNDTLGAFVRTPYYFDNAANDDLLLTPMFSAQDKLQMLAEWRHRFANGEMNWNASAAHAQLVNENGYDRGKQLRGHIIGDTQFALTNKWKAGTNIAYVSDKSYMLRYGLPADEVLINKGYLNYYNGRDHGSGTVYYFLDQRPNNALVEPLVAPELRYSAFGEPNKTLGGRWSFDSSLLITKRRRDVEPTRQGANTRRLSLDSGWERQFVSGTGFLTTLSGNVRTDSYWADNVPDPNQPLGTGFSNVARVRPFTQANLFMRYPLGRHGDGYQQIVEPLALLTVAPRVSRNLVIPNEDSLDVEFDETNLFLPSRFTGVDRVEGGTRVAYGMRHSLISDSGARIDVIGGQIYQFKPDDNFGPGSGLNDNFSDYVARTQFIPGSWMDLSYGVRLDKDDFDFTKQDVMGSIGHQYFRPNARYLFLKQTNATTLEKQFLEEITFGFTSQFAQYWTLSASHTRAMQPEPGPRDISLSLLYKDECLTTGVTASRTYTSRLDVEPGSTILFNLYLRNIGGFATD